MNHYYEQLNLPPNATREQVDNAYHLQRARLQADLSLPADILQGRLAALDEAYLVLSRAGAQPAVDDPAQPGEMGSTALTVTPERRRPDPVVLPADHQAPAVMVACPHCGQPNPAQALMCGACGLQTSRPCPKCGLPVALGQSVCPRCQTYIPEQDQRRFVEGHAVAERVENERIASDRRVRTLEAAHRARTTMGVVFYLVLCLICSGAAGLAYFVFSWLMAI